MHDLPRNRLTAGTLRQQETGQPVRSPHLPGYAPYPLIKRDDLAPIIVLRAQYEDDDPRPGIVVWLTVLLALLIAGAACGALLYAAGLMLR